MIQMRKKAAVLGSLVAGSALLFSGAPAFAGDAQFPGEASKLNMYEDDNYSGHFEGRASYDTDFANDSFNDKLSSFVNKTDNWWVLYNNVNYGGAAVCVRPHSHDNNIGDDTAYEDDISSVKMFGTTKPSGCTDTTGDAN